MKQLLLSCTCSFLILLICCTFTQAQGFRGKGGFGGPPSGKGFGGPPGGGRGFGGPPGGGKMFGDPERMFGFLSRGRGYVVIDEMRMLRQPLADYAKKNGISGGKLNKEQFIAFTKQMQSKIESGGSPIKGRSGGDDRDGKSSSPEEKLKRYTEYGFKRMDDNEDGQLNKDEVTRSRIRDDFNKYDKNRNGLISKSEYYVYMKDRYGERFGLKGNSSGGADGPSVVRILLEEELYRKPSMIRLGQLPGDLDWFDEMDVEPTRDGQLELREWRQAEKSIPEFLKMDRNDDGYITPQEALFFQNEVAELTDAYAKYYKLGSLKNYPSVTGEAGDESISSFLTRPDSGSNSSSKKKKSFFSKFG